MTLRDELARLLEATDYDWTSTAPGRQYEARAEYIIAKLVGDDGHQPGSVWCDACKSWWPGTSAHAWRP